MEQVIRTHLIPALLEVDAPAVPTGAPTYFPTSSSGDSSDEPTYLPSALFPTLSPAVSNQTATAAPASTT